MSRDAAERSFEALEAELNGERAAALSRTASNVEAHLRRCRELQQAIGTVADPVAAHDTVREYRIARAAFERARWQLCLQRETLGLYDHGWVDRIFPTPPAR